MWSLQEDAERSETWRLWPAPSACPLPLGAPGSCLRVIVTQAEFHPPPTFRGAPDAGSVYRFARVEISTAGDQGVSSAYRRWPNRVMHFALGPYNSGKERMGFLQITSWLSFTSLQPCCGSRSTTVREFQIRQKDPDPRWFGPKMDSSGSTTTPLSENSPSSKL